MRFTLLLALSATAAQAETRSYECIFATECVGTEGCAESGYQLSFTAPVHEALDDPFTMPGEVEVSDLARTFDALAFASHDPSVLQWTATDEDGGHHLFTLQDETARYSVHLTNPGLALYYEGTCMETQP